MFTPRGLRTFQTRFRSLLSHNRVLHSFTASFSTIAPKSVQQQLRSSSKHSQQPRNRAKPVRITMSFHPGPQATEIVAPLGVIASTSISLSEPECALFSVLLNTLKSYPELSATTVRVAGGWVRDKVLGRESHDLDIALDTHTGTNFAVFVNDYLSKSGHSTSRIATIASNPDQSKHLETATVKILGQLVDFVNLRSETYAGHSRIPTMEFGTPQQDAERRDFTINALFYNVNTAQIEDFTGQGYSDLRAGLLRTPLPPITTFHDDPLRIMRAIRFGSRFGFELHPDIVDAIANPDVQKELMTKVSRERIGSELDNMLLGARPVGSIELLHSNGLLSLLFQSPVPCVLDPLLATAASVAGTSDAVSLATSPTFPWASVVPVASRIEPHLTYLSKVVPLAAVTLANRDLMRQLYYACILVGFSDAKFTERINKNFDVTRHIVKDVVKRSAGDADAAVMLQSTALAFIRVATSSACTETFLDDADVKLACGRRIRQAKELCVLASSLCSELGKRVEASWLLELAIRVAADPVLSTAWNLRALINGKEIAKDFGVAGPEISRLVDAQIDYLVLHPHATVEDCAGLLRTECAKK